MYGDDELYHGGLSIRTTLDTTMQLAARTALREGLETYDRRHGYRGALGQIELEEGWETRLEEFTLPRDLDAGWMGAVVLSLTAEAAEIGFADGPFCVALTTPSLALCHASVFLFLLYAEFHDS